MIDQADTQLTNTSLHAGVLDEYDIRLEHTDEEGAPDMVSNSGIYTFTSGVDGSTVQARYTFVYAKQPDGEWLILTHHSSEMPEELVPREQGNFVYAGAGLHLPWWFVCFFLKLPTSE